MQVDSRILVDVATDINAVKNNLEEAIDLASTSITQIAAPGADEVSSVISALFGEHGVIFTDLGRAMTALQGDFSVLLDHSARAYTDTELSAVGLMQDTEAVSGTVRKEEVRVEKEGDVNVRGKGTTKGNPPRK